MSEDIIYSIGEFAKLIGVSIKTLERWDDEGKLLAHRTPTRRRFYTEKQRSDFWRQSSKEQGGEVYVKLSSKNKKIVTKEQLDSLKLLGKQLGIEIEFANRI